MTGRLSVFAVALVAVVTLGLAAGAYTRDVSAGGDTKLAFAGLVAQDGSEAHGLVVLEQLANNRIKVHFLLLDVLPGGPRSSHAAHIHSFSAGATPCDAGAVETPFRNLRTRRDGLVHVTQVVTGDLDDAVGDVIAVHQTTGEMITCGPITAIG